MEQKKPQLTLNLDFRSTLVGFLLALCLVFVLGADTTNTPKDEQGRFQCSASDTVLFVLDTQTGQLWQVGRTDTYDFGTPWQRKSVRKSIISTVE